MIGDFAAGLMIPLKGAELISRNKKIRHRALAPFALTFIVFLIGIFFGLPGLTHFIPWSAKTAVSLFGLGQSTSGWAEALRWLLILVAFPVGIFGLFYALFMLSRLVAAPFYALLAECVLLERGLKIKKPSNVSRWVGIQTKLFAVALIKTGVFVVVGAILFFISFVPGLGIVSMAGFLLMAAFDVIDTSLEALEMNFRERLAFFVREFPTFAGLATVLGLVFLVPGLNFFLFPAAVAGGSEVLNRRRLRGSANMDEFKGAVCRKSN